MVDLPGHCHFLDVFEVSVGGTFLSQSGVL